MKNVYSLWKRIVGFLLISVMLLTSLGQGVLAAGVFFSVAPALDESEGNAVYSDDGDSGTGENPDNPPGDGGTGEDSGNPTGDGGTGEDSGNPSGDGDTGEDSGNPTGDGGAEAEPPAEPAAAPARTAGIIAGIPTGFGIDGDGKLPEDPTSTINTPEYRIMRTGDIALYELTLQPLFQGTVRNLVVHLSLPMYVSDGSGGYVTTNDPSQMVYGVAARFAEGDGWALANADTMMPAGAGFPSGYYYGNTMDIEYGSLRTTSSPGLPIELMFVGDPPEGAEAPVSFSITVNYSEQDGDYNFEDDSYPSNQYQISGYMKPACGGVTLVSSNLEWRSEPGILNYPDPYNNPYQVYAWKRINYVDYTLSLYNESQNNKSYINWFQYLLDFPIYQLPAQPGVLPYDFNRWVYDPADPSGPIIENTPDYLASIGSTQTNPIFYYDGQFIGKWDEGGLLIFDVTDKILNDGWGSIDDDFLKTLNPIPYSYSGSGGVNITVKNDAVDKGKVSPRGENDEWADLSQRHYVVKTPYSADCMYPFYAGEQLLVTRATVHFGLEKEDANKKWTKTDDKPLRVYFANLNPEMTISKNPLEPQAPFATEGSFVIDKLKNTGNFPMFDPFIYDKIDLSALSLTTIEITIPQTEGADPDEAWNKWMRLADPLCYSSTTTTYSAGPPPVTTSTDDELPIDLSYLNYDGVDSNGNYKWILNIKDFMSVNSLLTGYTNSDGDSVIFNGGIYFYFKEMFEAGESFPGQITINGIIEQLSDVVNTAEVHYTSKICNRNIFNIIDSGTFINNIAYTEYWNNYDYVSEDHIDNDDAIIKVTMPDSQMLVSVRTPVPPSTAPTAFAAISPILDVPVMTKAAGYTFNLGNGNAASMKNARFTVKLPMTSNAVSNPQPNSGFRPDSIVITKELLGKSDLDRIEFYDVDDISGTGVVTLPVAFLNTNCLDANGNYVILPEHYQGNPVTVKNLGTVKLYFTRFAPNVKLSDGCNVIFDGYFDTYGQQNATASWTIEDTAGTGMAMPVSNATGRLNVPRAALSVGGLAHLDPAVPGSSRSIQVAYNTNASITYKLQNSSISRAEQTTFWLDLNLNAAKLGIKSNQVTFYATTLLAMGDFTDMRVAVVDYNSPTAFEIVIAYDKDSSRFYIKYDRDNPESGGVPYTPSDKPLTLDSSNNIVLTIADLNKTGELFMVQNIHINYSQFNPSVANASVVRVDGFSTLNPASVITPANTYIFNTGDPFYRSYTEYYYQGLQYFYGQIAYQELDKAVGTLTKSPTDAARKNTSNASTTCWDTRARPSYPSPSLTRRILSGTAEGVYDGARRYTQGDITYEMGYKSIVSMTAGLERTNSASYTSRTETTITLDVPYNNVDVYYIKLNKALENYVQKVDIYRNGSGGQYLWYTAYGIKSANPSEWSYNGYAVNGNTPLNSWRINTADVNNITNSTLYTSGTGTAAGGSGHSPYYKEPFAADIVPAEPVSKIVVTLVLNDRDPAVAMASAPDLSGGFVWDLIEATGRIYKHGSGDYEDYTFKETVQEKIGLDTFVLDYSNTNPGNVPQRSSSMYIRAITPKAELKKHAYYDAGTQPGDNFIIDKDSPSWTVPMGNLAWYGVALSNYNPYDSNDTYNDWNSSYNYHGYFDKFRIMDTLPDTEGSNTSYNFTTQKLRISSAMFPYLKSIDFYSDTGFSNLIGNLDLSAVTSTATGYYEINIINDGVSPVVDPDLSGNFATIHVPTGVYLRAFACNGEKLPGTGDRSTEYDGIEPQVHDSNLQWDIAIGGFVTGNNTQRNNVSFSRESDKETAYAAANTSYTGTRRYADLVGNTLTLKGLVEVQQYDMIGNTSNGNKLIPDTPPVKTTDIYDYGMDSLTPNRTGYGVKLFNDGDADVDQVTLDDTLFYSALYGDKPHHTRFRLEELAIPAKLMSTTRGNWYVSNVTLKDKDNNNVPIYTATYNSTTGQFNIVGANNFTYVQAAAGSTEPTATIADGSDTANDWYRLDVNALFASGALSSTLDTTPNDATIRMNVVRGFTITYNPLPTPYEPTSSPLNSTILKGSGTNNKNELYPANDAVRFSGRWVDNVDGYDAYTWTNPYSRPTAYPIGTSGAQTFTTSTSNIASGTFHTPSIYTDAGATCKYTYNATTATTLKNRYTSFVGDMFLLPDSTTGSFTDLSSTPVLNVDYTKLVPGDSTYALLNLKNNGVAIPSDNVDGNLTMFAPMAHLRIPDGFKVKNWRLVEAADIASPGITAILKDLKVADLIADAPVETSITRTMVKCYESGSSTAVPAYTNISGNNYKNLDFIFDKSINSPVATIGDLVTVGYHNAVYILVELEVTNLNANPTRIYPNQPDTTKDINFDTYMRPTAIHCYDSYDVVNPRTVASTPTSLTSMSTNVDFNYNSTDHRTAHANPNGLRLVDVKKSTVALGFVSEDVSGADAIIKISDLGNWTYHDDTRAEVILRLDTPPASGSPPSPPLGFRLTEWPVPAYPASFTGTGDYASGPIVYYSHDPLGTADNAITWKPVPAGQTPSDVVEAASGSLITMLRFDYGKLPAYESGTTQFKLPDVEVKGIGLWQALTADDLSKSYSIRPQIETYYKHYHNANFPGADVSFDLTYPYAIFIASNNTTHSVLKGMPDLELNIQAYDSMAAAKARYQAPDTTKYQSGTKTTYRPEDDIYYKISLLNKKAGTLGVNGAVAFGTGPFDKPVIIDRIPEYLIPENSSGNHILSDKYLINWSGDAAEYDIAQAIADGVLDIQWYQSTVPTDNTPVAFTNPKVTVHKMTAKDIGGSQIFVNKPNGMSDDSGALSNAQPNITTTNPADNITYYVMVYDFDGGTADGSPIVRLNRGEAIEIAYRSKARLNNLPIAYYGDSSGRNHPVYAPMMGQYGNDLPTGADTYAEPMAMDQLLHDAGVTGILSFEQNPDEFMTNSMAYLTGSANPVSFSKSSSYTTSYPSEYGNTSYVTNYDTYYDSSMRTGYVHGTYLKDGATTSPATNNGQYVIRPSSTYTNYLSDTWVLLMHGRTDGNWSSILGAGYNNKIMWAQNSLHMTKAWLYANSEMLSDKRRTGAAGSYDTGNFFELDGVSGNYEQFGLTYDYPQARQDNYVYAVEYGEEFTVRLHAVNYGDEALADGVEFTEVFPAHTRPAFIDEYGAVDPTKISAYYGTDQSNVINQSNIEVEVLQNPAYGSIPEKIPAVPFLAPKTVMEDGDKAADNGGSVAGDFNTTVKQFYLLGEATPWVVKITVRQPLGKWWNRGTSTNKNYLIFVDLRAVVERENTNSYWFDELFCAPVHAGSPKDHYYQIYSKDYGGLTNAEAMSSGESAAYMYNDAMPAGMEFSRSVFGGPSYSINKVYEPYGMYIRGLNTRVFNKTKESEYTLQNGGSGSLDIGGDGRSYSGYKYGNALVPRKYAQGGDALAVRFPTLRIWADWEESQKNDRTAAEAYVQEPYAPFTLNLHAENIYLASYTQFQRTGMDYPTTNRHDDTHYMSHQASGGARGSLIGPVVSVLLPNGIVPVDNGGKFWRLDGSMAPGSTGVLDYELYIQQIGANDDPLPTSAGSVSAKGQFSYTVTYLATDDNGNALNRYQLQFYSIEPDYKLPDGYKILVKPKVAAADYPDAMTTSGQINRAHYMEYQKTYVFLTSQHEFFKYKTDTQALQFPVGSHHSSDSTGTLASSSVSLYSQDILRRDSTGRYGKIHFGNSSGAYRPINPDNYFSTLTNSTNSSDLTTLNVESYSDRTALWLKSPFLKSLNSMVTRTKSYVRPVNTLYTSSQTTFNGYISDSGGNTVGGVTGSSRLFARAPYLGVTKGVNVNVAKPADGNPASPPLGDVGYVMGSASPRPTFGYGQTYWYSLKVENKPSFGTYTANNNSTSTYTNSASYAHNPNDNRIDELQRSGDVLHSEFIVSDVMPSYMSFDYDPADDFFDNSPYDQAIYIDVDTSAPGAPSNFVRLTVADITAAGGRIEYLDESQPNDAAPTSKYIRFKIILPDKATAGDYAPDWMGALLSGQSFTLHFRVILTSAPPIPKNALDIWYDHSMDNNVYVSLWNTGGHITDPSDTFDFNKTEDVPVLDSDKIVFTSQPPYDAFYRNEVQDSLVSGGSVDYDRNESQNVYTTQTVDVGMIKPSGEIRKNLVRPRVKYEGGYTDDPFFSSDKLVEFMITYAKNTGAPVPEFIIVDTLPPPVASNAIAGSGGPTVAPSDVTVTPRSVSTGNWELPDIHLGDAKDYRVFLYYTTDPTLAPDATAGWELINPVDAVDRIAGTALDKNATFEFADIPGLDEEQIRQIRQIRWVITNIADNDRYLIPNGFRLAVDADPTTPGDQEVIETDPDNESLNMYPDGVLLNAPIVSLEINSVEEVAIVMTNRAELWSRYSDTGYFLNDESAARFYMSRDNPVVDIQIDTKYFKESSVPTPGRTNTIQYSWSDNLSITFSGSRHMKYAATITNCSKDMWAGYERIYSEDELNNPVVAFDLPNALGIDPLRLELVDSDAVFPASSSLISSPLNDGYSSPFQLSENGPFLWTWRVIRNGKSTMASDVDLRRLPSDPTTPIPPYCGSWNIMNRDVLRFEFTGKLVPGDQIEIIFIGIVTQFSFSSDTVSNALLGNVYNGNTLITPLIVGNTPQHYLGLSTDAYDQDDNTKTNDRYVTTNSEPFTFTGYDDYIKNKKAYSRQNASGSSAPAISPVAEGEKYSFKAIVTNPNDPADMPTPAYSPVIFDILPHSQNGKSYGSPGFDYDTLILGDKSQPTVEAYRGSTWQGYLIPESLKLTQIVAQTATGATTDPDPAIVSEVPEDLYDIYVGPVEYKGGKISPGAYSDIYNFQDRRTSEFYSQYPTSTPGTSMRTDGGIRDTRMIKVASLLALERTLTPLEYESLVRGLTMIWVQFKETTHVMEPLSSYTLSYDMRAPLNLPMLRNASASPPLTEYSKYAGWNTFASALYRKAPGESNEAGVYLNQPYGRAYIGDYVWLDENIVAAESGDGIMNESYDDPDKRTGRDIYAVNGPNGDPGINGVKVELLSSDGFPVDREGRRTWYSDSKGRYVALGQDGNVLEDIDLTGINTYAEEPVVFTTTWDVDMRQGYYILSDLAPGDYKLRYTFPENYKYYGISTQTIHNGVKLNAYSPGETIPSMAGLQLKSGIFASMATTSNTLVAETETFKLEAFKNDADYVDFDVGVTRVVSYGGTAWKEDTAVLLGGALDGWFNYPGSLQPKNTVTVGKNGEVRLEGITVTAYEYYDNGSTIVSRPVVDLRRGEPVTAVTDANGDYMLSYLPIGKDVYLEIELPTNYSSLEASPITHKPNPLDSDDDNDLVPHGSGIPGDPVLLQTEEFTTDIPNSAPLYTYDTPSNTSSPSMYTPRTTIDLGFTAAGSGTIGDFVWRDDNRNGIQDIDETGNGVKGVEIILRRYSYDGSSWKFDNYSKTTTTDASGLYFFTDLYSVYSGKLYGYRVFVNSDTLPDDMTLTKYRQKSPLPPGVSVSDEVDSDGVYIKDPDNPGNILELVEEHTYSAAAAAVYQDYIILSELKPNNIDFSVSNDFGLQTAVDRYDMNLDLGLVPFALGAVEGVIWGDSILDGLRDKSTELLLPGYDVHIEVMKPDGTFQPVYLDSSGKPTFSVTAVEYVKSSTDGTYRFENLPIADPHTRAPYEYRVVVSGIKVWQDLTTRDVQINPNDDIDSDFGWLNSNPLTRSAESDSFELVGITALSPDVNNLYSANNALHVDLGLYANRTTAIIGDRIWFDKDPYGIQDTGESGVKGVEVKLYRFVPDKTYSPTLLPADFVPAPGVANGQWVQVTDSVTSLPVTAVTDANGYFNFTVDVLDTNPSSQNYEMPYFYRFAIEKQDNWEVSAYKLAGIGEAFDSDFLPFELYDKTNAANAGFILNNDPLLELLDTQGFSTSGLSVGNLLISRIANMYDTNATSLATSRHYIVFSDSTSGKYDLVRDDKDIDCGILEHPLYVEIGDYVWEDSDKDGLQGSGEKPVKDIRVRLYRFVPDNLFNPFGSGGWISVPDASGVQSKLTDNNGRYTFLVPVCDPDPTSPTYLTPYQYRVAMEITPNRQWTNYHAGDNTLGRANNDSDIIPTMFFDPTDYEWHDYTSLTGITGITRDLFTGVSSVLKISGAPLPFTASYLLPASRYPRVDFQSVTPNLATDLTADGGVITKAAETIIAGNVWDDANLDGNMDANEKRIPNIRVSLYRFAPEFIVSSQPSGPRVDWDAGEWELTKDINGKDVLLTDNNGYYEFNVSVTNLTNPNAYDFLMPYVYRVVFEKLQNGTWSPYKVAGVPEGLDSDAVPPDEIGNVIELYPLTRLPVGINQAFSRLADISDYTVFNMRRFVDFDTTRPDPDIGAGFLAPPPGNSGSYSNVNEPVAPQERLLIGNYVWDDKNNDGLQGGGEPGIPDVSISLYRFDYSTGVIEPYTDLNGKNTLKTDKNGHYQFVVPSADSNNGYAKMPLYYLRISMPNRRKLTKFLAGNGIDDSKAYYDKDGNAVIGPFHMVKEPEYPNTLDINTYLNTVGEMWGTRAQISRLDRDVGIIGGTLNPFTGTNSLIYGVVAALIISLLTMLSLVRRRKKKCTGVQTSSIQSTQDKNC